MNSYIQDMDVVIRNGRGAVITAVVKTREGKGYVMLTFTRKYKHIDDDGWIRRRATEPFNQKEAKESAQSHGILDAD